MPFFRATFAVQWCREAGESSLADSGSIESRPIISTFAANAGVFEAPLGQPAQLPPDLLGMDAQIMGVHAVVTASNGTLFDLRWSLGQTTWSVNGVPTTNGAANPVMQANNAFIAVNSGPVSRLQIDGNVETAIAQGAGATPGAVVGTVFYRRSRDLWGRASFSDYIDNAEDPAFSFTLPNTLARINREIRGRGVRFPLGVTASGTTLVAEDCNFAAPAGDRRIFITAADIGNQPEQIPANVGANTPQHFKFFPGAFFRRTDYIRAVNSDFTPDQVSISDENQSFQPFRLQQVVRRPFQSQWFIIVDGTPHLVWIDHGALDLRRARDIWNRLWVPALRLNQAATLPLSVNVRQQQDPIAIGTTPGNVTGLIHRLRYLQYAALLDLADNDQQDPITVDIPQGDTAPLVG